MDNPQKVTWEAYARSWRVKCQTIFRESLHDLANLRVIRKILCVDDFECDSYTLHLYYIYSHYPENCKEVIQKKPLERFLQHTHFVRESYTSSREKSLLFLLLPSPIVITWEKICTQTRLTHIQSIESVLELGKHYVFAKISWWGLVDAIRQYCGTWITSEDKTPRIPLVARTWRGSSTLGRLSLEGLLVSLYTNLFTNGSFQLRGS